MRKKIKKFSQLLQNHKMPWNTLTKWDQDIEVKQLKKVSEDEKLFSVHGLVGLLK